MSDVAAIEAVRVQWHFLENEKKDLAPSIKQLVHAAALRPELRQLFPVLSLERWLRFSRFVEYPYAFDIPYVRQGEQDQFEAHDVAGNLIARGSVAVVLDAVVVNLPPGCGAARSGPGPVANTSQKGEK